MNKYVYKIILPVGILVSILLLAGVFDKNEPQQSFDRWKTKIDDRQPVTVTVTPLELGKNAVAWRFDIVLDTHSGSLDQDLMKETTLADGKGNVYQPISWEGPGPGGHHREGVLIFKPINPAPVYVELKIKNIGGIPERLFLWDIE